MRVRTYRAYRKSKPECPSLFVQILTIIYYTIFRIRSYIVGWMKMLGNIEKQLILWNRLRECKRNR